MQRHRSVVKRTERPKVRESFERRVDEVDGKCQPEQEKDLSGVRIIMLAPVGDDDIVAGWKKQGGDEVEDERRHEQPQKQQQCPLWSVTPAVLHPPRDNYCQKYVHHPERM